MKTSPAFQFYPGDYLRSMRVQMMTLEEEGIYVRLLSYCWIHGSIPSDPEKLRLLLGKPYAIAALETVVGMFRKRGEKLVHDRLEAERLKQKMWREKSSEGGKKGAKSKWGGTPQTPVNQQPEKGWSSNGDDHSMTLQSSVSDLQSSVSGSPGADRSSAHEREMAFIPDAIDTPGFRAAWDRWLTYLAGSRHAKSLNFHTLTAHLVKCVEWGAAQSITAIDNAIFKGLGAPCLPFENDRATREANGVIGKRSSMAG